MASTILKPYESKKDPGPFRRFLAFMLLILVAVIYGLMTAVLPMQLLSVPLVPIIILIAIILWMLPDIGGIKEEQIGAMMLWYIGFGVVWPSYVAFDVPGLPWITPTRITVFTMLAVIVLNFSSSSEFRGRLKDAINEPKLLRNVFWLFWAATTFSLVFSNKPTESLNKYFNNQIFWTMMFPLSAFLATRPGFVMKMWKIVVIGTAVIMLSGIYEYRIERVFWLDHLPSFLKVDPEYLSRVMKSQARAGTDIYRVRGNFATSLYFSEFLAMVFPFFLHFTVREKRVLPFVLLLLGTFGMMTVMYLTNARSAMVGLVLCFPLYLLFVTLRERKINSQSVMATAMVVAYPVAVTILAALVELWPRLHVMVLGGGQHQASSDARKVQWAMGWPKIFSHPFGYGVSRNGEALGYYNLAGEITVDSHYLTLMLDSGIAALPLFIMCFMIPAWLALVYYREARTPEQELLAPLALGLVNFVVIKSVLTSEGSVPLAFVMSGCIIGLVWQRLHPNGPVPVKVEETESVSGLALPAGQARKRLPNIAPSA